MSSGLVFIFFSAFLAATILPLGSEAILLAYWASQDYPTVWLSVVAAGLGNTLGGVVTYAMGRGLRVAWQRWRERTRGQKPSLKLAASTSAAQTSPTSTSPASTSPEHSSRTLYWLNRFGPVILLLSWLPVVGDPLCVAAGSLRLRFMSCLFYMTIGKFSRYAVMAWVFLAWSTP
jgi:membrane protein YqaA with SNARE-associated domain